MYASVRFDGTYAVTTFLHNVRHHHEFVNHQAAADSAVDWMSRAQNDPRRWSVRFGEMDIATLRHPAAFEHGRFRLHKGHNTDSSS